MTTSPTQGEHAQTEALRPKFGDLLRNTMASESNPRRDAYFIREVHRSGGGVNPGRWFEMTDGKGETWLSNPQNMVPAAPAQPAAPQGVAYAELADVDALAQEIRRVDGSHNLGAGALAEALMPFLRASHGQAPAGAVPDEQMIAEYGIKASRMMARDLTRFDAACEVDKYLREQGAPGYYRHRMSIILFGNVEGTEASRAPENSEPSPTAQAAPAAGAVAGPDGRMSHELRGMIEGMSVSVDVSTGDHDAGHRYFGTVTEVMDCNGDKYGVTLLVQDAEPNFAPTPAAQADSALEDAANYRWWLQFFDTGAELPTSLYAAKTGAELDAAIRAARKQGAKHDNH